MSQDRFDKINAEATVEWRLVNAKIVKEHFEASVLPTPLNAIEHLLVRPRFFRPALPSTYLSVLLAAQEAVVEWRKKRRPKAEEDTASGTRHPNALCWGRHYVFPASEMDFAPLHASFPLAQLAQLVSSFAARGRPLICAGVWRRRLRSTRCRRSGRRSCSACSRRLR